MEDSVLKRLLAAILILIIMVPVLPIDGSRISIGEEDIQIGKVIEVVDGEVVKVLLYHQSFNKPTVMTIKVIGLSTEASDEGFKYASSRLLGQTVFVKEEKLLSDTPFSDAHIFVDFDKTYAEEVLELGYGKVDDRYKEAMFYNDFLASETNARLYEIGVWETAQSVSTDRININRASSKMLQDVLDLTSGQATDVIAYREENLYNTILEIMAASDDLDGDWMDAHRHLLSVITNINKTSYLELSSLLPDEEDEEGVIDQIDYFLKFNEVTDIKQLYEVDRFSRYVSTLEPFITIENTNILEEPTKASVNINTVGKTLFMEVTNLSESAYEALVKIREEDEDYVITTLKELFVLDQVYVEETNYIFGNHLSTLTNMNKADEMELQSLFNLRDLSISEQYKLVEALIEARPFKSLFEVEDVLDDELYAFVKPFIYVFEDDVVERYNPNTAEEENVAALDKDYKGYYSNFTNINTATEQMLLDLNEGMTDELVDDIMAYRYKYPFRSNRDLYTLFEARDMTLLYNKIARYITYE